jgi:hypothetical protein
MQIKRLKTVLFASKPINIRFIFTYIRFEPNMTAHSNADSSPCKPDRFYCFTLISDGTRGDGDFYSLVHAVFEELFCLTLEQIESAMYMYGKMCIAAHLKGTVFPNFDELKVIMFESQCKMQTMEMLLLITNYSNSWRIC